MRLMTAAGLLVFSVGTAMGAYMVDLEGGDRMTVDSYWEDGDRVHLMSGGVDLSVPKSRIRSLKRVEGGDDTAGIGQQPTAPAPAARPDAFGSGHPDRDEMEAQQRRIEHHLLRVQQERFEAGNRGEPSKTMRRLDKEFKRTQQRRRDVIRSLEGAPPS